MLNNLSFLNIVMQTPFQILHLVQVYKDMPTHRKVFSGEKNLPYCQVHFCIPNINMINITITKVVNSVVEDLHLWQTGRIHPCWRMPSAPTSTHSCRNQRPRTQSVSIPCFLQSFVDILCETKLSIKCLGN